MSLLQENVYFFYGKVNKNAYFTLFQVNKNVNLVIFNMSKIAFCRFRDVGCYCYVGWFSRRGSARVKPMGF